MDNFFNQPNYPYQSDPIKELESIQYSMMAEIKINKKYPKEGDAVKKCAMKARYLALLNYHNHICKYLMFLEDKTNE